MIKYLIPLTEYYRNNKDAEVSLYMKKYFRGKYDFFGIKTPVRKNIYKDFFSKYGYPDENQYTNILKELWNLPEREYQYFGMELFRRNIKNSTTKTIESYEYMITHKSWWDTVDGISINLVGPFFKRFTLMSGPFIDKWVHSDNIWLQRSAILFQLKYKEETNKSLLFQYIKYLSGSKEFFVQKAIGWALRELSKSSEEDVVEFVNSNHLAALSKREALRLIMKAKVAKK